MCAQAREMFEKWMNRVIADIVGGAQDAHISEPAAADDADAVAAGAGGSAGGKRKSDRIASSGKQNLSEELDCCEIRKHSGGLSLPSGVEGVLSQGCFCWEGCKGSLGEGCSNAVPDVDSAQWVEVSAAKGECYGKYLTARQRIARGTVFTIFGGVTVKRHTHFLAYDMFEKLHAAQNGKAGGEPKFQYSTRTGTKLMQDSLAWLIPSQDLALLKALMTGSRFSNTQLKTLVQEQTEAQGLGQYAQHTCCPEHVNAYIFPMYIEREEGQQPWGGRKRRKGKDDSFMDLQAVGIRAQKDIEAGDEILIKYVGLGRAGEFGIFDCACCQCAGPCRR